MAELSRMALYLQNSIAITYTVYCVEANQSPFKPSKQCYIDVVLTI